MRGRRPKPTALKKLQGNPGRRPLNELEPKPARGLPPCPDFLQGEARRHWDEIGPQLEAMGVLAEIDGTMLAAYCQAYAQWRDALEKLKLGTIIKAPSGYPVLSPYCYLANKAMQIMRGIAQEFGMTPSSRSRLKMEKPAEENPLAEFMKHAPAQKPLIQ